MTTKDKLIFFSRHGMSISYIANMIEVDISTLSKWINNKKGITCKNEEKVELALKKIVEEFSSILEE